MDTNPFETIDKKLNRIETLLKGLYQNREPKGNRITDIDGYCEYRKDRSKATVYIDLSKGREVPGSFKVGKKWRFDLDIFDEWLENKKTG